MARDESDGNSGFHAVDARGRTSLDSLLEDSRRDLTPSEASQIVGGLSRTTKIPCHSWGISAKDCRTGGLLARIEGSTCHGCYALKGAYSWPKVSQAYERRLARADHPDWVDAMGNQVLWQAQRNGEPYFRWFDSGDIQSTDMLRQISDVARRTSSVQHWLPTREYSTIHRYFRKERVPDNLTIRLSAPLVDGKPPKIRDLPTSTVHHRAEPRGFRCPAYDTRPATCGDLCRACWDPSVLSVSYPFH